LKSALLLGAALSVGCASQAKLAASLASAARPDTLPLVVACWEKEFEQANFTGGYLATVDFTVEEGTSRIKDAKVKALEPAEGGSSRDPAQLGACVESALNRSSLPLEDSKSGPGFRTSSDLVVRSYRIAFVDDASRRDLAEKRQANVLLGPRADRCQGLYTHNPPRDPSTLYAAIADAESKAAYSRTSNQDDYARELQRTYDSQLELRASLTAELASPDLPEANRKQTRKHLERLEQGIQETAARIGCTPPPAP
jgi:hypothetical protein